MKNPYRTAQDYQMWRRSVSHVEPHLLDPMVKPKFQIEPNSPVATAGSCFAQHIARQLKSIGFNYFVPEDGGHLPPEERKGRNYGIFSARYGNIYTTVQLEQLFDEAFCNLKRRETAWLRPDGRFVDPYRPQIEPEGFSTETEVLEARSEHLSHVRRVFKESQLFIFTLGLTEAWRSKRDQMVFPLAPGVIAGSYNPNIHEFHNFSPAEVSGSLARFVKKLKKVNPEVNVLLTVSPVPLIATYEERHVLTSTFYSKSALRVAADQVCREFDWVDYFPSYEIISSPSTGGMYFQRDHREVGHLGVAHAMRCFVKNFTKEPNLNIEEKICKEYKAEGAFDIVCEEDLIDEKINIE